MTQQVKATPSKRFFVSMLTRDIDLKDSILDLLDNCVDGVLRQTKYLQKSVRPYEGYWAKISASPERFIIEDNCGGISLDIAIEEAFVLGRENVERDLDIPTVGMYGIGMKRAMFKMGRHSIVKSRHGHDQYAVEIPPEWLGDNNDWDLDLSPYDIEFEQNGTLIEVRELYDEIAIQFNEKQRPFLENLKNDIERFYSVILKKGFRVYLNDEEISPDSLDILFPTNFDLETIPPYVYQAEVNGVEININIGFYRPLATEQELEDEMTMARSSKNAGWTVICNDRVVVHRDTSSMTGWGINGIPKFHNQFIAIAGTVHFTTEKEPINLPLNTTKRGLDTSSPVYWHAIHYMQEGLRKFIDFTNHWKGREKEAEVQNRFNNTKLVESTTVALSIPVASWKTVKRDGVTGKRYTPELPKPRPIDVRRRISFLRPENEVKLLGRYFYDDESVEPSDIGIRCFEDALKLAKGNM